MAHSSSTKKGQVWFFDFMIAVLIFVSTLVVYFNVKGDVTDTRTVLLEDMIARSKLATGDLMSKGYPEDWEENNVTRMGLIGNDEKFDTTKISKFFNFTVSTARTQLGLGPSHYFAYLEYTNGTTLEVDGVNQSGEVPPDNSLIVQSTRLGVFNRSFMQLRFLVWRVP